MTQYIVEKREKLPSEVMLPASKSISNRALIISALSGAAVMPENVSDCDDTFVMVRALTEPTPTIDIMAAGTAMRFLTAYLSVQEGEEHVLTGTERMKHRPISILVNALRQLGADIEYVGEEGYPPLRIRGKKLEGGSIELAGNVSSQYISAMLMIGPMLEKGMTLKLKDGIVSRPYIDMTLSIMREFGAKTSFEDDTIGVDSTGYKPIPYYIENDWSASSYWYEMVALTEGSEVRLPGLFAASLQGDQGVRDIFGQLGVETVMLPGDGGVQPPGALLRHTGKVADRLDIDMLRVPDLAQTVVVTCCMLGVKFHITGLQSLKIKETDRITALRTELRKLGYVIGEENDSILFWNGERCQPDAQPAIDTYEDHRMAMSFAPCSQKMDQIRINNPEVVSKSYPTFWEEFEVKVLNE